MCQIVQMSDKTTLQTVRGKCQRFLTKYAIDFIVGFVSSHCDKMTIRYIEQLYLYIPFFHSIYE